MKQEEKVNLTDINNSLKSLDQTIKEVVLPLVYKHDTALYGKDGTNGISSYIEKFKNHIEGHWKMLTVIIGICGIIFSFINLWMNK